MEINKQNTEHESSSGDDHHWVEKLFPPRFTFQNLLEKQSNTNEQNNSSTKPGFESQWSCRRQIYLTALKEIQYKERLQTKEALMKRIIRHEQPVDEGSDAENETERCIWNEKDISALRAGFEEVERDRWRLKQQLSYMEEQLKAEHEQRMKLQGLAEKLEEQLNLTKKRATRQALMINNLKSENKKINAQLNKLIVEVREKEDEAESWKTSFRKAKKDIQGIEQERSNLAWDLERVQAQWKSEGERLQKAAQIESKAEFLRLQREVEQTKDDLRAERESHTRSRTALELLRRHFSSQ